jgi:D-arabinose 1-dehydrogenase-like Zn-dependent alcohol dehydrogenase
MNAAEVRKFLNRHVLIRTVDGHEVTGFLRDVGYQGVTFLVNGQRVYGPMLEDIVFIGGKKRES